MALSMNDDDNQMKTGPTLNVYKANFESEFLWETENLHNRESDNFLANHTATEYMKRVDHRLSEENERIEAYLHSSTSDIPAKACDTVLIEWHLVLFQSELRCAISCLFPSDLQLTLYSLSLSFRPCRTPTRPMTWVACSCR